jgi:hypothetical protein
MTEYQSRRCKSQMKIPVVNECKTLSPHHAETEGQLESRLLLLLVGLLRQNVRGSIGSNGQSRTSTQSKDRFYAAGFRVLAFALGSTISNPAMHILLVHRRPSLSSYLYKLNEAPYRSRTVFVSSAQVQGYVPS